VLGVFYLFIEDIKNMKSAAFATRLFPISQLVRDMYAVTGCKTGTRIGFRHQIDNAIHAENVTTPRVDDRMLSEDHI
jgi:hypothetical protein